MLVILESRCVLIEKLTIHNSCINICKNISMSHQMTSSLVGSDFDQPVHFVEAAFDF